MNPVHLPNKKLYFEQVWTQVRKVPSGRVATYGQIAKLIPVPEGTTTGDYQRSAARWVGSAMAACPDDVPWQRVISSQGKIRHPTDPHKQKQLLQLEGVLFSNEKIDLQEYQWRGPGQSKTPAQGRLF